MPNAAERETSLVPSQPAEPSCSTTRPTRRDMLMLLATAGVGTTVFQRSVAAQAAQNANVTSEMIRQAEWIAGIELTDDQREATARDVNTLLRRFHQMREVSLQNGDPPALWFDPAPGSPPVCERPSRDAQPTESAAPKKPKRDETLAFLPIAELSALLRKRDVSSEELTRLALKRLRRYDPLLKCVVNLTEETALQQARQADREIAAGRYRGPLHGIPWGAKDLIAWPGYPTTWGAPQFENQMLSEKATVAGRLEEAGAVLVAKLSLGALAMGDKWFGGMTRNPWDPEEGSSGSSAGSAAATSSGLVTFALGSETRGSIISPCRRCGATGLRPTFGRVSRHGCMSLAWSMDKIGPIARSVEDCALVFAAIHGADGLDATAVDRPFRWPNRRDLKTFRVGYVDDGSAVEDRDELRILTELGVQLVPIELPRHLPTYAIGMILNVEAAAVFDELTRRGITEGLNTWPERFREGEFVPAVEYLRANRIRLKLMREMQRLMQQVDVYVNGNDLGITNLTGHPCVVLPAGFRSDNGVEKPFSVTFTGQLYGESDLLRVAHAFQQAGGQHLRRPPIDESLRDESAP